MNHCPLSSWKELLVSIKPSTSKLCGVPLINISIGGSGTKGISGVKVSVKVWQVVKNDNDIYIYIYIFDSVGYLTLPDLGGCQL